MAHSHSRSVAELRRESERTRAELSQTVDILRNKITDTAADIRHKVSPENIKAEVSGYVTERSRHWLDALKQHAMDNPMQALAAGIAVAVPAFKIVRNVPPPLLMIGAGLALTSPRVRGAVADKASASFATAENVIGETVEMAREGWESAAAGAEGAIDDARSAVTAKTAEVRAAASGMADEARQRAEELSRAARHNASSATETLSSKMSASSEAAKEALDTTRTKLAETFNTTRASAERLVHDHAAIVGGLGLAIGALIAASLPSTKIEEATLGEASDNLRKTAAEAASEKFDEAKTAAMSAAEAASEKISEAALGSTMSRGTEDASERLKTVAEDTITTAFEPSQTDHR